MVEVMPTRGCVTVDYSRLDSAGLVLASASDVKPAVELSVGDYVQCDDGLCMRLGCVRAIDGGVLSLETIPSVAADTTFIHVNGGRASSSMACWDEDRAPVLGESVGLAGGDYVRATLVSIDGAELRFQA